MRRKKTIGIIGGCFLTLMLVLTFFSNTIMNSTLPIVRTQSITGGTITPMISGSGTVESMGEEKLTAERDLTVLEVCVSAGEEVKAGAVLLRVLYEDNGTLEQLQEQLEQAEDSYARAQISAGTPIGSGNSATSQQLQNNLEVAQKNLDRCKTYLSLRTNLDQKMDAAENDLSVALTTYTNGTATAQTEYDTANRAYASAEEARVLAEANAEYAKSLYEADPSKEAQYLEAQEVLDQATGQVNSAQNSLYAAAQTLEAQKQRYTPALESAQAALASLQEDSSALEQEYIGVTDYIACENAVLSAQASIASFNDSLAAAATSNELQEMDLENQEEKIEKLREEIKEEEGKLGEKTVTAAADGKIQGVFVKAGGICLTGTELLNLEYTASRYSVQIMVTSEEAASLEVGMTASVSGEEFQRAILEQIKDGETGQKKLSFSLDHTAASPGQSVTLNLALDGGHYDVLVPNSAIYEDARGTFVYGLEFSSSVLGNRYKAVRISVQILASDDSYSAVDGSLSSGGTVILYASKPLENGQLVRLEG